MTSALPFARGTLDSMPSAREAVDPLDLLRRGPEAFPVGTGEGVTGVSAFLIDAGGLVAVRVPGDGGEPLPVRRPGGRVGADTDTPFATIPADDGGAPFGGPASPDGRTSGASGVPLDQGGAAVRTPGSAESGSVAPVDEAAAAGRDTDTPAGAATAGTARPAPRPPAPGDLRLWRPPLEEALRWAGPDGAMLMGRSADGVVHVAVRVAEPIEASGVSWGNIRWCGHLLPDDDSALALQAVALVRWHAQSRFCARCGHAVETTSAGWTTTCPQCEAIEYPRQDPAVIMAVVDDRDRVLMAHNAAWRAGFWSVLAGFVEAGESPDRALRREVLEEVGLRVGEVRYVAAQPWPMPRSLMLGFLARLEPGAPADPRPDAVEIDQARFFTREELAEEITSGRMEPPGPTAIARYLLEEWFGAPLPESPRRIDPLRRS